MVNIYENVLYNYQKQVVDESLKHKRFFLALEPGLGKTLTSLAIAQIKGYKKIIVVCQKSKIEDWSEDIEKFLEQKITPLTGNKKKDDKLIKNFTDGAIIASYQTIWRRNIKLDESFIMIIDESQYLKSHTTSIGKWGAENCENVGDVLLLSGSPQNKPEDMFNQMVMLGMNLNWKQFGEMFFIIKEVKYPGARWPVKTIAGYRNVDKLFEAFKTQSFSMKTEDAIDLPKQNFADIKLVHEKKKVYDFVKKEMIYEDLEISSGGVLFLRLRQLSSGYIESYTEISNHKKDALKDLLESNERSFVIFYNFVQELEDIKDVCKKLKIDVYECNGSTKNYDQARTTNKRFVIAGQYQSAAEGHNWQFVQNQLYYSPPVSFMKYKQSLARIHRIGQTKPVFYYHFITINTVEQKMYNNLKQGKDYDEKIFANDCENTN